MQAFMKYLKAHRCYIILFCVIVVLEFFFSNDISAILHPEKQKSIDLQIATTNQDADCSKDGIHFYSNGDSFEVIIDSKIEAQSIYLDFDGPDCYVNGTIDIKDESRTKHFNTMRSFSCNPGGTEHTLFLPLHSRGNITALQVSLTDGVSDEITLRKVILNYNAGIQYNIRRFLLMVLLLVLVYIIRHYKLTSRIYDCDSTTHTAATICTCFINLLIVIAIFCFTHTGSLGDIPYPLKNDVSDYSIMVQQFDAFQKGHFNIELDFEKDIESLDNPYDYSERLEAGNYWWDSWDHVYKDGKFYSYFGTVPILTIYYPHYWLTHTLPDDAETAFIISVVFVILCILLIRQILRTFHIRADVLSVLLAFLLLPSVSLMLMVQSCADMYYIPMLSANLFVTVFLYTTLKAYEHRNHLSGVFWFSSAAIAIVLSIGSRPMTTVSSIALAAPLYLHLLMEQRTTTKQKLRLVIGFAVPLLIGAALMMWYNAVRFGSPFDFGVSDQLTIADIHYNKISISASKIKTYIQQYWLLPFTQKENFPFIGFSYTDAYADGSYVYHQLCMGLLAIPLNLMLFFIPAYVKKRPLYQKAMVISGFSGAVIVLYLNYCLGGIHIRYTGDVSFLLALLSVCITFFIMKQLQKKKLFHIKKAVYAVLFISLMLGYFLVFENERNFIRSYATDFYLQVQQLFQIV